MNKVIIMCAIPGAGKSTYIKNNFPNAYIVSADHYFMKNGSYEFDRAGLGAAHGQCFHSFMEALDARMELVVVDNTNTTMKEINTYAKPATEKGYDVEIVVLQCPTDKAFGRNVHGVPLDAIEKMAARIKNTSRFLNDLYFTKVVDNS